MNSKYFFIAIIFIIIITTIFAFEKKNIIETSIFTRFYQPVDSSQYDNCACKSTFSGCLAFIKRDGAIRPNCMSTYGTTNIRDCGNCKYCKVCVNKNGTPTCVNKSDYNKENCPFSFDPCDYYLNKYELPIAREKCPYIKNNYFELY
jgi:hypothetical protein